ncbi:MAG: sigma-70 family RNA polymerase sigma factor [Nitrospirae bacterium]|nr:sigma-70 family RNA polymerase sigma factor [Nitrospirota bacterium]
MKNNLNDNELIHKCLHDEDRDAWEVFVRRYSRLIWNFIRRTFHSYSFTCAPEDVEDLFNAVLLSLLENDMKKLRQFNSEYSCSVSTWLTTMTIRMTIDHMRKDRTRLFVEPVQEDGEIWDTIADNRYMPDRYAEDRQQSTMLAKAINALSPKDRRLYDLLLHRGLSPEDTAKVLNMSVSAVYTGKHRIIEKIKKYVQDM